MISYAEALRGWHSRDAPAEPKAEEVPAIPARARVVVDTADTRHSETPDELPETPDEPLVPAFELQWRKKRLKVLTMLDDPEGSKLSNREIARRLGVTHGFVNKLRRSRRRLFEQTVSLK
jgi:hypothetical protein